jgi:hypothetical protein
MQRSPIDQRSPSSKAQGAVAAAIETSAAALVDTSIAEALTSLSGKAGDNHSREAPGNGAIDDGTSTAAAACVAAALENALALHVSEVSAAGTAPQANAVEVDARSKERTRAAEPVDKRGTRADRRAVGDVLELVTADLLSQVARYAEWDFKTLAACSSLSRSWHSAFGALLNTLPARLESSIADLENGELLRRYVCWAERRRLAIPRQNDLSEVASFSRPPLGAAEVINAVCSLALPSNGLWAARADFSNWTLAKQGLKGPQLETVKWGVLCFIDALTAVAIDRIPEERLARVRELQGQEYFNYSHMSRRSTAVAELICWATALLDEADFFASELEARAERDELNKLLGLRATIASRISFVEANPYQCSGCSTRFATASLFSKHRLQNSKRSSCTLSTMGKLHT